MRNTPNLRIGPYRVRDGFYATDDSIGNNGAFFISHKGVSLKVMVSDGTEESLPDFLGWEHVSVSTKNRCPTWEEMCFIKELFWKDDEVVFQLHPAKKDWINCHPFTLHLWRKRGFELPLPPKMAVGPTEEEMRLQ